MCWAYFFVSHLRGGEMVERVLSELGEGCGLSSVIVTRVDRLRKIDVKVISLYHSLGACMLV